MAKKKAPEMYIRAKNWENFLNGGGKASNLTLCGEIFFSPKELKKGLETGKLIKIKLAQKKNKKRP